jgi:mannose-6-phosphate isomerase-like protein (cupin superfamily)
MNTRVLLSLALSSALASGAGLAAQTAAAPKPAAPAQAKPPVATPPATSQAKPAAPATPAQATPRPPAATPAQPGQAQPAPVRRPAAPATARGGVAMTVTNERGMPLSAIHVRAVGPMERVGETNASGQINFPGLQAGTYRVRFSGDEVVTFEREIVIAGGRVADADITLNPAEKPAAPPPAAAPPPPAPVVAAAAPLGPAGRPQSLSVVDVLEKEYVGKQPRRESLLSCSGNTRTTMVQLNEPQPERMYEGADAVYYVVGGEGNARIGGRESRMNTNAFLSVPRGTPHSFERRGGRPFILLAVLSGEPCETAK